jgi:hypothetical protein
MQVARADSWDVRGSTALLDPTLQQAILGTEKYKQSTARAKKHSGEPIPAFITTPVADQ